MARGREGGKTDGGGLDRSPLGGATLRHLSLFSGHKHATDTK